jgi:hypothetical protein
MNNSTKGVTLFAGFISDLLATYQGQESARYTKPLFDMAKDVDLSDPTARVPMQLYNDMCDWIGNNMGTANLRKAGEFVGNRAYDAMRQNGVITDDASPQDILKALKIAADTMIQDPLKRGWEILELGEERAVLRRTQTFHPVLQEGLLKSLVQRSRVAIVTVSYLSRVSNGDEFDDYEIRWAMR